MTPDLSISPNNAPRERVDVVAMGYGFIVWGIIYAVAFLIPTLATRGDLGSRFMLWFCVAAICTGVGMALLVLASKRSGGLFYSPPFRFAYSVYFSFRLAQPSLVGHFDHFGIRVTTFIHLIKMSQRPNKSPEPTAVGAVSSAVAVHVAGRRWLSFFR